MSETHFTHQVLWEHKKSIALLILLAGLLLTLLYSEEEPKSVVVPPEAQGDALQMKDVELFSYDQALLDWKLTGDRAGIPQDSEVVHITEVVIWVYEKTAENPPPVTGVITSRRGTVDWAQKVVTLEDDVEMTRQNEFHLSSQRAIYHYNDQTIVMPEEVQIDLERETMLGRYLVYDLKTKTVNMKQAVLLE